MSTNFHAPLNNELLEGYVSLEYILLGDLRDLLEEQPQDEQTRHWLLTVLDALLDTLPRQFALREQGGYLTDVLEQFPTWYQHIDRLHTEQRALYVKLDELRDCIAEREVENCLTETLKEAIHEWMISLEAHHRHERRLVQTAYTLDIGCGD